MAAILCPNCNKSNPDALEICQFCGTPLKNRGTEPLPTIRPGEMPVKQQTSELENTLPSWLRDIRKGEDGENIAPAATSPAAKPETPTPPAQPHLGKQNEAAAPLDFLAGLSQANDDDEAVPDWLASLKTDLPSEPAPAAATQPQQPVDWLAGLQEDSPPQASASEQPAADWAFNNDAEEPAAQASEETPDWLAALKAQDTSINAPAQAKPVEPISSSDDMPDWLSNLGGEPAASVAPAPAVETPSSMDDDLSSGEDLPSWLSGMAQTTALAVSTPTPSQDLPTAGDFSTTPEQVFPDWLAGLGGESAPATPPSQPAPVAPATPVTSQDSSSSGDFPDWLAGLGGESAPATPPSQPAPVIPAASQDSSSGADFPDWLAGLANDAPKAPAVETPVEFDNPSASDEALPGWLEAAAGEKPSEKPPTPPASTKKAFSTGSLGDLGALDQPGQVPDWMAGLGTPTPAKTPEPATPSGLPGADAFDWLSGLDQGGAGSVVTEPKPTGQPESAAKNPEATPVSFDVSAPEASTPSPFQDSGSAQSLDSIFSMEMPDWLSGFTPSEPEPAKAAATSEQPTGPSVGNISPADLPSWVQAMRPIESVMSGAQSDDDDQTVEKEGPLAGLRSVLPALTNAPGLRKPKAYSIKLQVDSAQMAQATLLENLIASEAESRPVSTTKRVVNIRSLRWVIALVLLLAVLVPAVLPKAMGLQFFPLPELAESSETGAFYNLVDNLPDAAAVLVVFDYQPAYAGEMEQTAGPVIDHLMTKNARLAFVSTAPTGVLMNQRIMDAQNKLRKAASESMYENRLHYIDLGYLPGDAAGIQVFAENPHMLGSDYQLGNLWAPGSGLDKIKTLFDFEMTIVLTDNPDTGRMWIEQTGPVRRMGQTDPALDGKPMVMAVSAQAAPMMRPYYASGQIKGMVSGLAGGAAYEATTQRPGYTGAYWVSYGAGMIAAEVLIVVGGVWALIQHLRMRRMEQQEQEEDEA